MISIPQAVRCFELSPCSELRFDLRWSSSSFSQQQHQQLPPVITVKLEPKNGIPVVADWFGFVSNSVTNSSNIIDTSSSSSSTSSTTLTFRIGCTRQPSSLCLFSPSGCYASIEGPAVIVQKSINLFNFSDFDRHQLSSSSSTSNSSLLMNTNISISENQQHQNLPQWPHWRKQVLQLHNFLHSQRLQAVKRGEEKGYDDILARIGPRIMVCSSRAGCGKTTVCKMLLNLAVRDGFQPLFVSADPSGTSLCGQPGCFSAFYADNGLDPTENFATSQASFYPTMQVVLPLEGASRSKRAEPWNYAMESLMSIAEKRTQSLPCCASGGVIVDTDTVDEFMSPDDLDRLVAVIDQCSIDYVIVIGSENLRNSLRLRLAGTLNSSSDNSDAKKNEEKRALNNMMTALQEEGRSSTDASSSQQQNSFISSSALDEQLRRLTSVLEINGTDLCRVRRNESTLAFLSNPDRDDEDSATEITLFNFAPIEGAEDYQFLSSPPLLASALAPLEAEINANKITRSGIAALQASWQSYFFGSATSPLSAFQVSNIPVSESKWCWLKAVTSHESGGIMPLLGAGEEQKSFFKAVAEPIDVVMKFKQHQAQREEYEKKRRTLLMNSSSSSQKNSNHHTAASKPSSLMIVALLRHHTIYDSEEVTSAEVIGFVGVVDVKEVVMKKNDHGGQDEKKFVIDFLSPMKSLPQEPHVFALLHSSCQP